MGSDRGVLHQQRWIVARYPTSLRSPGYVLSIFDYKSPSIALLNSLIAST
jgi:hypothetical protein